MLHGHIYYKTELYNNETDRDGKIPVKDVLIVLCDNMNEIAGATNI